MAQVGLEPTRLSTRRSKRRTAANYVTEPRQHVHTFDAIYVHAYSLTYMLEVVRHSWHIQV